MFPAPRGAGVGLAGFMDFKSGKEGGGKERQQVNDSLRGEGKWSRAGKKGSREGRGQGLRGAASDYSRSSKKPTEQWLPTHTGV